MRGHGACLCLPGGRGAAWTWEIQRRLGKSPTAWRRCPLWPLPLLGSAPTPGGCAGGGCSGDLTGLSGRGRADVPDQFPACPPPLHPVCSGPSLPSRVVPPAQPQDAQVCSQSGWVCVDTVTVGPLACPPGGPRLTSPRGRDCRGRALEATRTERGFALALACCVTGRLTFLNPNLFTHCRKEWWLINGACH